MQVLISHPTPPAALIDLLGGTRVRIDELDPRRRPWRLVTDDWQAVLRRLPLSVGVEHVRWLHRFLDRLALTGFPAPRPLPILAGSSLTVVDGAIWETVSYVPGQPLLWDPRVPIESAGALLARFHRASLEISPLSQRPGALPMEDCRPKSEKAIYERFQRELVDVGHHSATRCVVHGDCTVSNLLVDENLPEVVAMIDFALAHLGPPESDISFAQWVNGRTDQPAIALDADRVRAFVAGYHRVRPLTEWAVRAIPLYLVGRGLQMRLRQELADLWDEIQIKRLHWLDQHRRSLEDVVASAITVDPPIG